MLRLPFFYITIYSELMVCLAYQWLLTPQAFSELGRAAALKHMNEQDLEQAECSATYANNHILITIMQAIERFASVELPRRNTAFSH